MSSEPGRNRPGDAPLYDLIVIGAGTAGLTAARLVARQGKRVALIERDRPGGDCLWTGCVPTKSLIQVAKHLHEARAATRFGIRASNLELDFEAAREHMSRAQAIAGRQDTPEAIASSGVHFLSGEARFVSPHAVSVNGDTLRARNFVIATGSRPSIPPVPGLDEVGFDTNVEVLDWRALPSSVAIVGGGPIGVEFAQLMARLGVAVTLVESAPRLLSREDPEASRVVERVLAGEGVNVLTGAAVTRVTGGPSGLVIHLRHNQDQCSVASERLIVATGRVPVTEGLDLAAAGVAVSDRGIAVDGYLRTSQPHIFAGGDVNGSPEFTHVAEDQARTIAHNIVHATSRLRRPARWNARVVPRVTFTDPEVASVGLTEEAARKARKGVRTWSLPLDEVDRAVTMGATDGFLKLVTARGWQSRVPGLAGRVGDEIVGATFVGPNAGDLLMPVVMAMRLRLPIGFVAWNMQAYPTLALGVRQVAGMPFESR